MEYNSAEVIPTFASSTKFSGVFIVYINGQKHLIIKSESEISTKKT